MPATAGKYGLKDTMTPSGQLKVGSTEDQQRMLAQMARISNELFESTGGLRSAGIAGLESVLSGGALPKGLEQPIRELYREGRQDMEDQYKVAREQTLSTIPSQGGQLNDQLQNLAMQRARSVGGLETQLKSQLEIPLRERLFQSALGIGFGQPPIALSGLSQAGGQYGAIASRAQAEQLEREQRAKEEWQQIGQMAGMAFGGT